MVKYRHLAWVIVFSIITLGIYSIYWFVVTALELKEMKAKNPPNPWWVLGMVGFSLLGMIITPFVITVGWIFYLIGLVIAIYFYWMYSKAIHEVSKGRVNNILVFVFFIIFSLISMIIVQLELNKHSKKRK